MADDDEGRPTFAEVVDAIMPPGTDKGAVWAALKGSRMTGSDADSFATKMAVFHQTGGHYPGREAPDIAMGPAEVFKAVGSGVRVTGTEGRPCPGCGGGVTSGGQYIPHHQNCGARNSGEPYTPIPGSDPPGFRRQTAEPQRELPAGPKSELRKAYEQLVDGGFSSDEALTFLAKAWAAHNGDDQQ